MIEFRESIDARSGPEQYLNDKEEEQIVNFIVDCSKIGYARSKKQILALVSAIVAKREG